MSSVYDLLKKNEHDLRMLVRCGVEMEDVAQIVIYEEYMRLSSDGLKKTAILAYLSDQYSRSERTIRRIVKRFSRIAPEM